MDVDDLSQPPQNLGPRNAALLPLPCPNSVFATEHSRLPSEAQAWTANWGTEAQEEGRTNHDTSGGVGVPARREGEQGTPAESAMAGSREAKRVATQEEARRVELELRKREVDDRTRRVQEAVQGLKDVHGFQSMWDFLQSFFDAEEFALELLAFKLEEESSALVQVLSRRELTSVTGGVLNSFSMDGPLDELTDHAPTLLRLLRNVAMTPQMHAKATAGISTRRDHKLVLAAACCMLIFTSTEKASNFQLVFGLFLLGSGAKKSLIEVLAHAGLSMSYSSIVNNVKRLSAEGVSCLVRVVHEKMSMIVWDNINIAFRVERVDSKDHFDNGTTATLIPLYNAHTSSNRNVWVDGL